MILAPDGQKMSKSKGNTIEPSALLEQGYGADSVRIMELFIGPWNQAANWSVEGMGGAYRFLQRVWTLTQEYLQHQAASDGVVVDDSVVQAEILRVIHQAIKKVTEDLETMNFNTAVAALMEALNQLYKLKEQDEFSHADTWRFAIESLLQLTAPIAPHLAEELWQQLGHELSIHTSDWPGYDAGLLVQDRLSIAVQINGKLRGEIEVASEAAEADIVAAAQANAKVAVHLTGKTVRKTIYVPSKIVNFVV